MFEIQTLQINALHNVLSCFIRISPLVIVDDVKIINIKLSFYLQYMYSSKHIEGRFNHYQFNVVNQISHAWDAHSFVDIHVAYLLNLGKNRFFHQLYFQESYLRIFWMISSSPQPCFV